LAAILAAAGMSAGCGSVSQRERSAAAAAERFVDAVADGDGAAACAVLAPETVSALEDSAGSACTEAILDEDLPASGEVETADVYGQWARAVTPADTLFLAMFRDGWRVVAAGCRPAGEGPYDCALQGG
jgi:hypothetical protein